MDFGRQDIFPPIPSVSIIVLLNPDIIITGHISLICLYWTIQECLLSGNWHPASCAGCVPPMLHLPE